MKSPMLLLTIALCAIRCSQPTVPCCAQPAKPKSRSVISLVNNFVDGALRSSSGTHAAELRLRRRVRSLPKLLARVDALHRTAARYGRTRAYAAFTLAYFGVNVHRNAGDLTSAVHLLGVDVDRFNARYADADDQPDRLAQLVTLVTALYQRRHDAGLLATVLDWHLDGYPAEVLADNRVRMFLARPRSVEAALAGRPRRIAGLADDCITADERDVRRFQAILRRQANAPGDRDGGIARALLKAYRADYEHMKAAYRRRTP